MLTALLTDAYSTRVNKFNLGALKLKDRELPFSGETRGAPGAFLVQRNQMSLFSYSDQSTTVFV